MILPHDTRSQLSTALVEKRHCRDDLGAERIPGAGGMTSVQQGWTPYDSTVLAIVASALTVLVAASTVTCYNSSTETSYCDKCPHCYRHQSYLRVRVMTPDRSGGHEGGVVMGRMGDDCGWYCKSLHLHAGNRYMSLPQW
ncbi:hypothetical protein M8818_006650 [Zalaria obscura]|uniref:Uncharacterized protein n=1 Tax=Zalaria obscura TaxID=2024903 RepID=A0ACC3S5G6_9PEZI